SWAALQISDTGFLSTTCCRTRAAFCSGVYRRRVRLLMTALSFCPVSYHRSGAVIFQLRQNSSARRPQSSPTDISLLRVILQHPARSGQEVDKVEDHIHNHEEEKMEVERPDLADTTPCTALAFLIIG